MTVGQLWVRWKDDLGRVCVLIGDGVDLVVYADDRRCFELPPDLSPAVWWDQYRHDPTVVEVLDNELHPRQQGCSRRPPPSRFIAMPGEFTIRDKWGRLKYPPPGTS